ncbi:hemocyte protein-glutamine gamma-glutamyltransferase-like [Pectinophora gossypiella]|nr:hemocyte protein-glutamine gamma-glutamyltransferase-like [Pectinophora gossypiella]
MEPLHVDVVYFYPKENAKLHKTQKYEVVNDENPTVTVLRRGQPFNGVVRFTRPYDEENDVVQLVFTLGDKPQMETQGSMFLRKDAVHDKNSWSAKLTNVQGETLSFEVSTPVTTPVGCWSLRVVTRLKKSTEREIYDFDQDIYILFNPWNVDDQTYMEKTELLEEYVQNDQGKVWVGPIKTTRGRPWVYGQFDATVLPACMLMLDRAEMPFHVRGDPIRMCRIISKIVNSNDDDGVLVGRWDGEYEDGTAPSDWTGSVEILDQFLQTQESVSYGQCWVFAGVVTTVCRALGIPSRVVSNLVSAHDANSSLTVDKYYSETMEEIEGDPTNPSGADSIWNYHVWNDVWMARPDLPPGYGGWQAVDATPQETSTGFYQCGPASLEAIKQGHTGFGYDVEFMLASVNADMMRWRKDPDSETGFSMVDTNDYHIGRMILTKKPYVFDPIGDMDREDVTLQYKHREHTGSERAALLNGVRRSARAQRYYSLMSTAQNDITFKLKEIDTVDLGKSFRVTVDIQNTTEQVRNIKATLSATSVYYNGVKAELVKKTEGKIFVGPKKHEQISILVNAEDYLPKLVEYCNMKISAMAIVDETKQSWADDDDFQVLKPNINIKFNEDLIIGQAVTATLFFENPLEKPLSQGEFRISSPGIAGRALRFPAPAAGPREVISAQVPLQPTKIGNINLVATYRSSELKDINGAATVEVFEG